MFIKVCYWVAMFTFVTEAFHFYATVHLFHGKQNITSSLVLLAACFMKGFMQAPINNGAHIAQALIYM